VLGVAILIQAARLQLFASERTMGTGTLVLQGDGQRRYVYNPRLVEAGDRIVRGSILDRNGIPLATNSQALLEEHRADYQRLGITLERVAASGEGRKYPFAGLTFHLLGDLRTRVNWGAPNTSFVERDVNATLQGYDDRATVVNVSNKPDGPVHQVVHRDLRELVPLVRYRHRPGHDQVRRILLRDRDVRTTIDIRLQKEVARLLEQHVRVAQQKKGAAIVIDPATGDLLASATYPWAGASEAVNVLALGAEDTNLSGFEDSLFDRPRYGLYPPGSSFKLVTAAAALQVRDNVESETFECKRLSDGRIGNAVRGWSRPVRDDILDTAPHGKVNMAAGIVHSCNAYFAQLGTYVVGAEPLLRMADHFGIRVASPNTPAQLRDALPQAAYGQGQVVATPLQMARVAAAVCSGGKALPVRWVPGAASPPQQVMPAEHTRLLGHYMRRVVTEGTGRAAGASAVPIAGKTGTAELRNQPSHAWFVGFAPYSASAGKKIAFAVIVENGRYGGRVAAPLAAEIVSAAARLGLVDRE
jgi:cell division protein FtsI/penicillin-binding protein 2